jgi:hypothetical protein
LFLLDPGRRIFDIGKILVRRTIIPVNLTSRTLDNPPEICLEHVGEKPSVPGHKIFDGVDVRGKILESSSKRRKDPVQRAYSVSLACKEEVAPFRILTRCSSSSKSIASSSSPAAKTFAAL